MYIKYFADGLKEYCNTSNIEEIYETLNIKIKELPTNSYLLNGNIAVYIRDIFDLEVVFISNEIDYNFRNFILAHELGHAIMHADLSNATFKNSLMLKNKFEREANIFALELLDIQFDPVEDINLTFNQLSSKYGIPEDIIREYIIK